MIIPMAKTPTAMEATTSPVRVLSSHRSENTLLQRGLSKLGLTSRIHWSVFLLLFSASRVVAIS